jgi:iron complex outermembrane receptor protein
MTSQLPENPFRSCVASMLAGAALFLALQPVVVAQTASPQEPAHGPAASPMLEEIVVTATKRETTVLQTPMSITAISGTDIQARGFTDFASVVQTIPGVSMQTSGPGLTEFELRGLSSSGGNSPTVGFYLNDTPLTAPAANDSGKVVIDPTLYDVSRIEVLRGPQGTLYGSSSMGGTIRLITNRPDAQIYDASAQAIMSDSDGGSFNHGENAMLNLPLLNGMSALRIVGSEMHTSGWIDRVVAAPGVFPVSSGEVRANVQAAPVAADYRNVNEEDLVSTRATLLIAPTEDLNITPMIFYQRISQDGPNAFDTDPGTPAHYQPYDVAEPFSDRFLMWSVNLQYKFPIFDITSNTAHWNRSQAQTQDTTEVTQQVLGLPSYYPPNGIGAAAFHALGRSASLSQELRLTSTGDTRFKWLLGGFYSDFESTADISSEVPGLAAFLGTANLFTKTQPTDIKQIAAFGEISYQITPQIEATAGLRQYHYNTSVDTVSSGVAGPTGSDEVSFVHTAAANSGRNPKFDLSYQPNEDLNVYATAAKGFRPGGGNQPIITGTTGLGAICSSNLQALGLNSAPLSFNPDTLWSYELGEKSRFLGERLSVNGAVYYEKWDGIQQGVTLPCGFAFTANAGSARVYGSELEVQALLTQGLTLGASAGYIHARISQGSLEAGTVEGDWLQAVPQWTTNVSLSYSTRLSDSLALISHVENSYVGARRDLGFLQLTPAPAYNLTNLRAGVASERWTATVFANNLFNKVAILAYQGQLAASIPLFDRAVTNQPRTIGLDVSYRFH